MTSKPEIDILEQRCREEDEEAVNLWFNNFHMPVLFKSGKVRSIARYKALGGSEGEVRFFTICKYDNSKEFNDFLACPEFAAAGDKSPEMQKVKIQGGAPVHCVLIKEWSR